LKITLAMEKVKVRSYFKALFLSSEERKPKFVIVKMR